MSGLAQAIRSSGRVTFIGGLVYSIVTEALTLQGSLEQLHSKLKGSCSLRWYYLKVDFVACCRGRGIGGVYHAVSEKYLQTYINEYSFRYNHRNDEKSMFLTVLEKI